MKEENIILNKIYDFGLRILKLYLHLRKNKVDTGLCSQLLNSGTSIGANVEEAVGGESRETRYWLRLLRDGKIIEKKLAESFIENCEEIIKILTAILNSSKGKNNS